MKEQPDFASHPRPRRMPAREIGIVVLAVLALALSARLAWVAREDAREARDLAREARDQLAAVQSRVGDGGRSPAEDALLSRAAAAVEAPPDRVVSALALVLPPDVRVDRLDIQYADTVALEMQVVARDAESWDLFLARIDQNPSFDGVIPGPEHRTGEVRSTVKARFDGGAR